MHQYPDRPRAADRPDTDRLLAAAGRGDLRAFVAFYDATAPMTFGLLLDVLRHQGRAERGTERVYLQLWRTAAAFEPTAGSARALLVAITLNELTSQVDDVLTRRRTARSPDGVTIQSEYSSRRPDRSGDHDALISRASRRVGR